jgi:MarR family transcriptional regulator, lower aerobic nicotinate degradation pathway regulator
MGLLARQKLLVYKWILRQGANPVNIRHETEATMSQQTTYSLDEQVGFLMRRANQRHLSLFAQLVPKLTPTQFAALSKLCEHKHLSQNALGRAIAMDAATIKGVVDRLRHKGLVASRPDPNDQRRIFVEPTADGAALFHEIVDIAHEVTQKTLAPLDTAEQIVFLRLLKKLT